MAAETADCWRIYLRAFLNGKIDLSQQSCLPMLLLGQCGLAIKLLSANAGGFSKN